MSLKPKVALSQDFLFQLAKLPSNVHTKVLKWAVLFQTDPKSPGINYEKIHAARDPNLKSVRIDQDWRGIVFKPESGDVYVLLYVDHHDAAYKWAERRKLAINPVTGAMQVVVVEEVAAVEPATVTEALVNAEPLPKSLAAAPPIAPHTRLCAVERPRFDEHWRASGLAGARTRYPIRSRIGWIAVELASGGL